MIDLLEAKTKQSEMSLRDMLSRHAFATNVGGNELDGLELIVDSTGTVGGLSQTTFPWWAGSRVGRRLLRHPRPRLHAEHLQLALLRQRQARLHHDAAGRLRVLRGGAGAEGAVHEHEGRERRVREPDLQGASR